MKVLGSVSIDIWHSQFDYAGDVECGSRNVSSIAPLASCLIYARAFVEYICGCVLFQDVTVREICGR